MKVQSAFILLLVLLAACARPGSPTGGPKDTTPPKVDTVGSTRNFSTRFNEKTIALNFDEWVVLKDAATQIVISPPTAKRPEVRLKGKTVILQFDESEAFRSNTTYTINFGSAVRDLHEDNPAQDLRFVFSTGDVIDSLRISGSVVDANTGDPIENIAVMLYDITEDSIIQKEKPYYFSRTDKGGQYTISNLRAGQFKCVAVDDVNQNLRWDGDGERLGFFDSLVTVIDTFKSFPALRLFKNQGVPRLIDRRIRKYGQVTLQYNMPPGKPELRSIPEGVNLLPVWQSDSVLVWYDQPLDTAWSLIAGPDTIPVRGFSRTAFIAEEHVKWAEAGAPAPTGRQRQTQPPAGAIPVSEPARVVPQSADQPAGLTFNMPITSIDSANWKLELDSVQTRFPSWTIDPANPARLLLSPPWKAGARYTIQLLPGAVTGWFGVTNTDTLQRILSIPDEKQVGNLNLTLENLEPGRSYVLELVKTNTTEATRVFVAEEAERQEKFTGLAPVPYTFRLIEDSNSNGRWDSGDYYAGRQPEKITILKTESLRANWDLEVRLDASQSEGRRRN